jgi:hypothetical protein
MKIVTAVNAMISAPHLISSVVTGPDTELFFKYAEKHKWSIAKFGTEDIVLYYYPGSQELQHLAGWRDDDWHGFGEMVRYSAKELGGKEVKDTFFELYRIVQERLFGVDSALDDIIDKAGWDEI